MKSSKCSCASARSWKLSKTSSRGAGLSTRCRVKAGTQRRVTARDRAQRADAHPRRAQQLGIALGGQLANRAVGEDQLHRHHLGGDVAQLGAGAVGAGRDRAGDGLAIDVAEVLHRQAELGAARSLRSASTVPAPTLTRREERSASSTPLSAPASIIVPSVIAVSVKE